MNPLTSPEEPHPAALDLAQATTRHTQGHFTIAARKLPISKSGPIDDMARRLGIPVPEMIFGDNLVSVRHDPTGWAVAFSAEAALDAVDKTGANMLQVAYAGEWSSSRERSSAHDIREVVKPYDWSYSTTYRGTETEGRAPGPAGTGETETETETEGETGVSADNTTNGSSSTDHANGTTTTTTTATATSPTSRKKKLIPVGGGPSVNGYHNTDSPSSSSSSSSPPPPPPPNNNIQIPLELLRRRDPILFFDEVVLFESELDDNGISVYSVKVRVMEQRMLLLARLYMRLDNVVARVRDTRVYVDFATDEVIREYTAKEDSFANVKRGLLMSGLLPDAVTSALRDANQVAPLLPVVEQSIEYVSLSV